MGDSADKPEAKVAGRVLVVDDELKNRELVGDVLEADGHEVAMAVNGQEALDAVSSSAPDAVLLDVMMPGMDGFEVCRRVKGDPETAHIPVLLVTALSERNDRIAGIEAGANDFITKPIDPREVALRTRNAVFAKQLHDRVQDSYSQLKALEDLRDGLTHMIVHDLRSPLTGISGYMQLLQLKVADKLDPDEMNCIDKSLGSCGTLLEMINSLLDVGRLEAGEMPLDMRECDLRAVAEDAVETLGAFVGNVDLSVSLPGAPVLVTCDPDTTRRVVANLLGNAIKFTPEGGRVELELEERPDLVRLSVSDSGPGIPPEYHERIFEKFGQVQARNDRKMYSTGLGLTFCKLAVEAHGGKMWLESEEGRGSVFGFELPRGDA